MKSEIPHLPVAVLGAGPIGLAAAAHLHGRGFAPLVFEAGKAIAAHLESYRHVRLFSPWQYNVDRQARRLLERSGWTAPAPNALPTAGELIDLYLAPLAALEPIARSLRLQSRVTQISRAGFDKVKTTGREQAPFVIRAQTPAGEEEHRAWAVIDATGTWGSPNPLGANGLPALGEKGLAHRIACGMPDVLGLDRDLHAGKRTLVVGAGHSAIGTLIALAELAESTRGTSIAWAMRGDNLARILGGGENDGLPARGELGLRLKRLLDTGRLEVFKRFKIAQLRQKPDGIEVSGESAGDATPRITGIDRIVSATGARPDLNISRELRLKLDPWLESTEALAPLIDPNVHSCGTVRPHGHRELAHPEQNFYAVGAKSYGRAPNFLLATGHEQVRSVVAALAGDLKSADDVQLELPETGVCSTDFTPAAVAAGCCGGQSPQSGACCVADAEAKSSGKSGCGCGPAKLRAKEPASTIGGD